MGKIQRAGELASAARLQLNRLLCVRGVDPDGVLKDLLGDAHLHREREALRDLPGVGPQEVEADELLVLGGVYQLQVAVSFLVFVVAVSAERALSRSALLVEDITVSFLYKTFGN